MGVAGMRHPEPVGNGFAILRDHGCLVGVWRDIPCLYLFKFLGGPLGRHAICVVSHGAPWVRAIDVATRAESSPLKPQSCTESLPQRRASERLLSMRLASAEPM